MLLKLFVCSLVTGHDLDASMRTGEPQAPEALRRRLSGVPTNMQYVVGSGLSYTPITNGDTRGIPNIKIGRAMCNEAARAWARGELMTDGQIFEYFEPQRLGPEQCGQVWNEDDKSFQRSPDKTGGLEGPCTCNFEIYADTWKQNWTGGAISEVYDTIEEARAKCVELGPETVDPSWNNLNHCIGVRCTGFDGVTKDGRQMKTKDCVAVGIDAGDTSARTDTSYKLNCRELDDSISIPIHWECRYDSGSGAQTETWQNVEHSVTDPLCACVYDEMNPLYHPLYHGGNGIGRHSIEAGRVTTKST